MTYTGSERLVHHSLQACASGIQDLLHTHDRGSQGAVGVAQNERWASKMWEVHQSTLGPVSPWMNSVMSNSTIQVLLLLLCSLSRCHIPHGYRAVCPYPPLASRAYPSSDSADWPPACPGFFLSGCIAEGFLISWLHFVSSMIEPTACHCCVPNV